MRCLIRLFALAGPIQFQRCKGVDPRKPTASEAKNVGMTGGVTEVVPGGFCIKKLNRQQCVGHGHEGRVYEGFSVGWLWIASRPFTMTAVVSAAFLRSVYGLLRACVAWEG
jgi:hypothetical protein